MRRSLVRKKREMAQAIGANRDNSLEPRPGDSRHARAKRVELRPSETKRRRGQSPLVPTLNDAAGFTGSWGESELCRIIPLVPLRR